MYTPNKVPSSCNESMADTVFYLILLEWTLIRFNNLADAFRNIKAPRETHRIQVKMHVGMFSHELTARTIDTYLSLEIINGHPPAAN